MEGSRAQSFDINNEKLRTMQGHTFSPREAGKVNITYFGHSCIHITSPKGITILIDPWRNDDAWGWWFPQDFPEIHVDIALSTHAHFDHDALHLPKALIALERLIGVYEIGDVRITGLADKHMSESVGKTRWTEIQKDLNEDFSPPSNNLHMDNIIFVIETGGTRMAHWGDNRPIPDDFVDTYLKEHPLDVLFLPVDESEHILSYTQADTLMKSYQPGITIPIHYLMHGVNTSLSTLQPCQPWVETHQQIVDLPSYSLTLTPGKFKQNGKAVGAFKKATRGRG